MVLLNHLVQRLTVRFCPVCSKREEIAKFGTNVHLGVENTQIKLIGSHGKIYVITISGELLFLSICLLVELKMTIFFNLQVYCMNCTAR